MRHADKSKLIMSGAHMCVCVFEKKTKVIDNKFKNSFVFVSQLSGK